MGLLFLTLKDFNVKLIFIFLGIPLLLTACMAIQPKYVGKGESDVQQRVTFIGEDNNHTNKYTRTLITLDPFPFSKKNLNAPYIISTYPAPKRIYVSCSNFKDAHTHGKTGYSEYRKSYIKEGDFKSGKFYQFKCSKSDRSFSGEYKIDMLELDELLIFKTKW